MGPCPAVAPGAARAARATPAATPTSTSRVGSALHAAGARGRPLSTGGSNLGPMARPANPARATKALVEELRAQGVDCSPRRLEDWRRVGLIPRGSRRSLGRGRGTEVVYPGDMAERCGRVAERMRRGQPWQVVALSLFAAGADLPEETVRAAYRWALSTGTSGDEDELGNAERGVDQLLSTAAGRRLRTLVTSHVKRSRVASDEPPSAVARSVLTSLLVVGLGGGVAGGTAMIELPAGMGPPVAELPPHEQVHTSPRMAAAMGDFSPDELVEVAEGASLEALRGAIPVVAQLLEGVPDELRGLIPGPVADLLLVLLAPLVVRFGRDAARLLGDDRARGERAAGSLSQAPATMDPGPPAARRPSHPEPEAMSA